jgi:hypothetical protein
VILASTLPARADLIRVRTKTLGLTANTAHDDLRVSTHAETQRANRS